MSDFHSKLEKFCVRQVVARGPINRLRNITPAPYWLFKLANWAEIKLRRKNRNYLTS